MDTQTLIDRHQAVLDEIVKAGPTHFYMSEYFCVLEEDVDFDDAERDTNTSLPTDESYAFHEVDLDEFNIKQCGAAACLAGFIAITAWNHGREHINSQTDAADWLQLPIDQPRDTYVPSSWFAPDRFGPWWVQYRNVTQELADRIEALKASG